MNDIVTLILTADELHALQMGFEVGASGVEQGNEPVPLVIINRLRGLLFNPPPMSAEGKHILVMPRDEMAALAACWEVGGEDNSAIDDATYSKISVALALAQA